MTDRHKAYSIAVDLHRELQMHQHRYPELRRALKIADDLAREMAWEWASEAEPGTEDRS